MAKHNPFVVEHYIAVVEDGTEISPTHPRYRGRYCDGLCASVAGTVNVVDSEGNAVNGVYVNTGWNPMRVKSVANSSGSATIVFAGWCQPS